MNLSSQVQILPRLLRFKENKRDQVITIENNTNAPISYEFSAAKHHEEKGQIRTLFQSNQPVGKINPKSRERIVIQYTGAFTKSDIEKAEVLQVVIDDSPQQAITIDCEFESPKLDAEPAETSGKQKSSDDDLGKIVNILNLNDDEDGKPGKKGKLATLNEILKPLTPKLKTKKLKNLNLLTVLIFLTSLLILAFSLYVAFLNGYSETFRGQVADYGLDRIVKLCLEENIQDIKRMLFSFSRAYLNSTTSIQSTPPVDNVKDPL